MNIWVMELRCRTCAQHAHGDGQAGALEELGLVPDHARGVPVGGGRGVRLVGGLPAAEKRSPIDGAGVARHRSSPPGAGARSSSRSRWIKAGRLVARALFEDA